MSSRDFVYSQFHEYYTDSSTVIPAPLNLEQREFAYLQFKERFMIRHKRFENMRQFQSVLSRNIPSDVYHSCAYYENPDFDMDKKGWSGADVVFDIDADHIPTSCNKIHDEWKCQKCEFSGKGITPEECPVCGGDKFSAKTWPCDLCIESTRIETAKLIDMLEKDFGFAASELHVFFSGHRGYHVHVEDEAVHSLDALARKEIVDYVTGLGLKLFEKNTKTEKKTKKSTTNTKFRLHDFGWNRRLKLGVKDFILSAKPEDFIKIGIRDKKKLDLLVEKKTLLLDRCLDEGYWDGVFGVGDGTWMRLAEYIKEKQSANIDTVVTTDIHRLIRMNGTLHGKTGLLKMEFPADKLEDFDPFTKAVAFKKGTAKVLVSDAPEFRIGGNTFGPYKNTTVELPMAAAIMLILKGRAEVAN